MLAYAVRGFGDGEDAIGNGISISADGTTWGKPTDVSVGFAGKQVAGMPGPGTALLLERGPKKGRLLVPSYHPYAYAQVTVSDDSGATWRTTNQTFGRMAEGALTQLPNGSVLLSMRRDPQLHALGRAVAVSNDGGNTFGYGTFRLNFHHFDHFEPDRCGHIHVRGAVFSRLRLKLADIVPI